MPNVFGIADDILIAGFDECGKGHAETLDKVQNLKLKKDKCLFRCMSIPSCGEIISWRGVIPDPSKIQVLKDIPPPKMKKELQSFLSILINCAENKDQEIAGISVNENVISMPVSIPVCTSIDNRQVAPHENTQPQELKAAQDRRSQSQHEHEAILADKK